MYYIETNTFTADERCKLRVKKRPREQPLATKAKRKKKSNIYIFYIILIIRISENDPNKSIINERYEGAFLSQREVV